MLRALLELLHRLLAPSYPRIGPPRRRPSLLAEPRPVRVVHDPPHFDTERLRARWPALRDEIWTDPIDRAVFGHAELVRVEGSTLVVAVSAGCHRLLTDRALHAAQARVARLLGTCAVLRLVPDKPWPAPVEAPPATGAQAWPEASPEARAQLRFDPSRPSVLASDGLLIQRAAVDVLLADGRMTRLGVLASFDPRTREPRRMSYVPIQELTPSEEVAP